MSDLPKRWPYAAKAARDRGTEHLIEARKRLRHLLENHIEADEGDEARDAALALDEVELGLAHALTVQAPYRPD